MYSQELTIGIAHALLGDQQHHGAHHQDRAEDIEDGGAHAAGGGQERTGLVLDLGVNCGHRCLTVYTAEEWKRLSDNYNAMSISQRSGATSLIFMNAAECSPDKQYRFSLTQFLLSYAGIDREVMIVGRAGQAEIWDAKEFADFERENLTPEKLLASLEAIGL